MPGRGPGVAAHAASPAAPSSLSRCLCRADLARRRSASSANRPDRANDPQSPLVTGTDHCNPAVATTRASALPAPPVASTVVTSLHEAAAETPPASAACSPVRTGPAVPACREIQGRLQAVGQHARQPPKAVRNRPRDARPGPAFPGGEEPPRSAPPTLTAPALAIDRLPPPTRFRVATM